jgi:ABC-2 type transport system permease protein
LVTAKTLAAVVNCIGLLAITWGASLVGVAQYQPDHEFYTFTALCMVALFIMEMIFLAVGILLGCAMKRYRLTGSVTVSVILVTYFLSLAAGLNEDLSFLEYFSPFMYFKPAVLLNESKFDLPFVGLSIAIIVVSMIGAYISYSKRDLYI